MSILERADAMDPNGIADMSIDYTVHYLAEGETIEEFDVTCPDEDIVISQETESDGVVRWRVTGGVSGTRPIITCTILTSAGRGEPMSIQLPIRGL